ncbi:MAG: DNA primase [Candidatus Aenigmarchaeota archaeon]|nr:DNA primase [Candidatus Aenigmarchaeota archaeon]
MGKLAPTSIKYIIRARITAKGVIEKPDVIGAVFGQTEGLLGSDLNLRELQETGKIGRIEVILASKEGQTEGEITIPSALDASETALIAATLETIERVGPCQAKIALEKVEDTRADKRKYVVDKAKEILKTMLEAGETDVTEITSEIKESVRVSEISSYKGLPCGPDLESAEDVIIVEGRADILNLLRHGIRNTIAVEGTSVPPAVAELGKEKVLTVFVDGDRGGQLIIKELFQTTDVDFVAVAPLGREVEELSKKEVYMALRSRMPAKQYKEKLGKEPARERRDRRDDRRDRGDGREEPREERRALPPEEREFYLRTLDELVGSRAACIFTATRELMGKVPVSELMNTLKTVDDPHTVIFDGTVDFQLNSLAKRRGVKVLVGMEREAFATPLTVLTKKDLEG